MTKIGQLTGEEEARRRRRLRSANGVSHQSQAGLQAVVIFVANLFATFEIHHAERLPPQPKGLKYRPWLYRRTGNGQVSEWPMVLAANHGRLFDIALIGHIRRQLTWICKPSWCSIGVLALAFQRWGAVPVFREDKDGTLSHKNTESLIRKHRQVSYKRAEMFAVVVRALVRGVAIVVFPEGTRKGSPIVDPARVKPTFAELADRADLAGPLACPVVPLAIVGCADGDPDIRVARRRSFRRLHKRFQRKRVVCICCEPIYPRELRVEGDPKATTAALVAAWANAVNAGREEGIRLLQAKAA